MNKAFADFLAELALDSATAGTKFAETTKKAIFHAHEIDWQLVLMHAEAMRLIAQSWALLAEQQIEVQQGLSNVTLGPTLFGDMLPGDVADGVTP